MDEEAKRKRKENKNDFSSGNNTIALAKQVLFRIRCVVVADAVAVAVTFWILWPIHFGWRIQFSIRSWQRNISRSFCGLCVKFYFTSFSEVSEANPIVCVSFFKSMNRWEQKKIKFNLNKSVDRIDSCSAFNVDVVKKIKEEKNIHIDVCKIRANGEKQMKKSLSIKSKSESWLKNVYIKWWTFNHH